MVGVYTFSGLHEPKYYSIIRAIPIYFSRSYGCRKSVWFGKRIGIGNISLPFSFTQFISLFRVFPNLMRGLRIYIPGITWPNFICGGQNENSVTLDLAYTNSFCYPGCRADFHHTQKQEFDPGSERTLAICLTHASRTWLASPSIHVGAEGQEEWPPPSACSLTQMICKWCAGPNDRGTASKVANGCVTRGNLPNSSLQILNNS